MTPDELLSKIEEYGGDMPGISSRFMGDAGLYAACLEGMFKEPAFEALEKSVTSGDYGAAFESAHALKGLSGNMGLTPLYKNVCILVESLRAKEYGGVKAEYDAVMEQFNRLKKMLS